ncbi:hypothetical protein J6590_026503 [Homalodisca vitripennis]|nr:hypothetical protein J6590_026503 [Homalodisca vitripennis]
MSQDQVNQPVYRGAHALSALVVHFMKRLLLAARTYEPRSGQPASVQRCPCLVGASGRRWCWWQTHSTSRSLLARRHPLIYCYCLFSTHPIPYHPFLLLLFFLVLFISTLFDIPCRPSMKGYAITLCAAGKQLKQLLKIINMVVLTEVKMVSGFEKDQHVGQFVYQVTMLATMVVRYAFYSAKLADKVERLRHSCLFTEVAP